LLILYCAFLKPFKTFSRYDIQHLNFVMKMYSCFLTEKKVILAIKMKKVLLITLALVALAFAEEQKAEGRQMNWNNLNFATKPGYSQSYQQSSYGSDSSDMSGSPSVQNAQAKSSVNYQGLVSQSLDGQDINRDGSYSAPSNYGSNNDYGYEASPDTSYGNAVGYGYDYQKNLPTPSGRFYSMNNPSLSGNPVPNSYLRGMPRDLQDHPVLLLSSMQSGKLPYEQYQRPSVSYYNNSNSDQMTNRAGYDEDAPLGGISSSTSTGSMLSSTSMRNPISRQDDFSYGSVAGGYGSIPPATGYGNGAYGYGGSYASPGYSSNYRVPYGGYSSYGAPSYSNAGYSGAYGSPLYSGSGYGSSGSYGGYGTGGYGGAGGYGVGSGYGGVYGSGYGGGYGSYGGYGPNYGLQVGYGFQPSFYKKPKKAFHDWLKGKDVLPYGYGSGYGYGSNYATIPYDYYYDPPSIWHLSKFAMKSIFKSMFKPMFKWLPFCSPFFYARSDRS
jgi:hypothetical protein